MEIREDGTWFTLSSVWPTRGAAWDWLKSQEMECRANRKHFRRTKIMREKHDQNQFTFLQGNEACAREWQDS